MVTDYIGENRVIRKKGYKKNSIRSMERLNPYKSIDTNSKQYKAAADKYLADVTAEEVMMTPEQKMLYELLAGIRTSPLQAIVIFGVALLFAGFQYGSGNNEGKRQYYEVRYV